MSATTKRASVYLENNPYVLSDYVVRVLIMVCHISQSEARSMIEEANEMWHAHCGTWDEALAEHIYDGMRKAGLSASISLVDEGDDPRPRYLDGTPIETNGDMPHWYQ